MADPPQLREMSYPVALGSLAPSKLAEERPVIKDEVIKDEVSCRHSSYFRASASWASSV